MYSIDEPKFSKLNSKYRLVFFSLCSIKISVTKFFQFCFHSFIYPFLPSFLHSLNKYYGPLHLYLEDLIVFWEGRQYNKVTAIKRTVHSVHRETNFSQGSWQKTGTIKILKREAEMFQGLGKIQTSDHLAFFLHLEGNFQRLKNPVSCIHSQFQ